MTDRLPPLTWFRAFEAAGRLASFREALPLLETYMKGIRFETGRIKGAAMLADVLELIAAQGLTPDEVEATMVPWSNMADALLDRCFKPIAVRD